MEYELYVVIEFRLQQSRSKQLTNLVHYCFVFDKVPEGTVTYTGTNLVACAFIVSQSSLPFNISTAEKSCSEFTAMETQTARFE